MLPGGVARGAARGRAATTCSWCAARACSALPGLLAARARGLPGRAAAGDRTASSSGEAFTWGKPWARGLAGRARCATPSPRATAGCATPTRSWRCRARSRTRCSRPACRASGSACSRTASTSSASGPPTPRRGAALRARLGLPEGVLAVYTGRLLRGKGLETLVEAFARRRRCRAALRLVLVGLGRGPGSRSRTSCGAAWRERGLAARVVFAGRVDERRGLPARRRPLRVPVALRGARHRARRGRGLRPAGGRPRAPAGSWTWSRTAARACSCRPATPPALAARARGARGRPRPCARAMGREARARRRAPLRRARRARALPGALPRAQLAALLTPAGTCSSCRWRLLLHHRAARA